MSTVVRKIYIVEEPDNIDSRRAFSSIDRALVYAAELYNNYDVEDAEERYKDLRQLIECHYIEEAIYVSECMCEFEDIIN